MQAAALWLPRCRQTLRLSVLRRRPSAAPVLAVTALRVLQPSPGTGCTRSQYAYTSRGTRGARGPPDRGPRRQPSPPSSSPAAAATAGAPPGALLTRPRGRRLQGIIVFFLKTKLGNCTVFQVPFLKRYIILYFIVVPRRPALAQTVDRTVLEEPSRLDLVRQPARPAAACWHRGPQQHRHRAPQHRLRRVHLHTPPLRGGAALQSCRRSTGWQP